MIPPRKKRSQIYDWRKTKEILEESEDIFAAEAESLTTKKDRGTITLKAFIRDIIIAFLLGLALLAIIRPTTVSGPSMKQSFHDGDYLLVSKVAYSLFGGSPEKGDVIVFESPFVDEQGNEKIFIKRVIAVPGDTVKIEKGKVYVNGIELKESYINGSYTKGNVVEQVIGKGEYFVLGDNRGESTDSRVFGTINEDVIIGKVFMRIYPFDDFEVF